MACNCITQAQLTQLLGKYSEKSKEAEHELKKKHRIKYYFEKVLLITTLLVALPILFGFVIYKTFFGDGQISLSEFFGLRETYNIKN